MAVHVSQTGPSAPQQLYLQVLSAPLHWTRFLCPHTNLCLPFHQGSWVLTSTTGGYPPSEHLLNDPVRCFEAFPLIDHRPLTWTIYVVQGDLFHLEHIFPLFAPTQDLGFRV